MALVRNVKDLGSLVRSRRKAKGLTQADLAALAGTSLRFITELERGARAAASISKVLTVCSRLALDVSVDARETRA